MRYAHVTRDGRVICSVPGCGFFIGALKEFQTVDGETRTRLDVNQHLLYDAATATWRPGNRFRRFGQTPRRESKDFRQVVAKIWRIEGYPPIIAEPTGPEDDVILGGIPLPATVYCHHGHQSILDPDHLGLSWWITHDHKPYRRP